MGKRGNRVNKHESVTCLMNVFADWMFFASTFWKKLQAKMEKVESPKRRKLQAFTVDSYKRLRELDTLPPSSSSVKRLARRILARTGLRYSTILLTDLPSCVRGL